MNTVRHQSCPNLINCAGRGDINSQVCCQDSKYCSMRQTIPTGALTVTVTTVVSWRMCQEHHEVDHTVNYYIMCSRNDKNLVKRHEPMLCEALSLYWSSLNFYYVNLR